MKLVDLDQTIFVPVVDETHGGVTVEMKMTVWASSIGAAILMAGFIAYSGD